jgi:hypothetical protein
MTLPGFASATNEDCCPLEPRTAHREPSKEARL